MQIRRYLEFIKKFSSGRAPFPCPPETVALYATYLARTLTYRSVLNYLSALSFFLKQNSQPSIKYDEYVIAATLKGIRREKGDEPRRAAPLLPSMLIKIFAGLTHNTGHVSWRAAVLCSFRALLRKAQVTESDSTLQRKHFKFFTWGMIITVRKSKTIQYRERVLEIPVARSPRKSLCAVHWTELHFSQIPAMPSDFAFRLPAPGGRSTPLTYKIYQETLKLFVDRAGLGDQDFSSHSLRRGGCTYLAMCGASIEELRARGDWASETIFDYLKTPLQVRIVNDMKVATALAAADI